MAPPNAGVTSVPEAPAGRPSFAHASRTTCSATIRAVVQRTPIAVMSPSRPSVRRWVDDARALAIAQVLRRRLVLAEQDKAGVPHHDIIDREFQSRVALR